MTWATVAGLILVQALYEENFISIKALWGIIDQPDSVDVFNIYGFVTAMMFFLMRDIALLLYFYFSDKPQRALATAFVYWVVLYLLVPLLLGVMGAEALNPVFLPDGTVNFAYAVLPPLIQAGLMWTLTIRRWRTRFGSPAV